MCKLSRATHALLVCTGIFCVLVRSSAWFMRPVASRPHWKSPHLAALLSDHTCPGRRVVACCKLRLRDPLAVARGSLGVAVFRAPPSRRQTAFQWGREVTPFLSPLVPRAPAQLARGARASQRNGYATGARLPPLRSGYPPFPWPRSCGDVPRRGTHGLAALERFPLLHGCPVGAVRSDRSTTIGGDTPPTPQPPNPAQCESAARPVKRC